MPAAFAAAHPVASALISNAGNIGSFLGGTAALGSLFGGSSGGTNVANSAMLMKYQMNLNKQYTQWLNENQYSQMRTGLENANYNPLLALGASPQQGSIGIGNVTNPESKTAQLLSVLSGLAQIDNLKSNTAINNAGILGKMFGSIGKNWNKLKSFLGSGQAENEVRSMFKSGLKFAKGLISSTAKDVTSVSSPILKGYISNISGNDSYDYFDKGQKLKVIDHPEFYHGRSRSYNMPPRSFPSGM